MTLIAIYFMKYGLSYHMLSCSSWNFEIFISDLLCCLIIICEIIYYSIDYYKINGLQLIINNNDDTIRRIKLTIIVPAKVIYKLLLQININRIINNLSNDQNTFIHSLYSQHVKVGTNSEKALHGHWGKSPDTSIFVFNCDRVSFRSIAVMQDGFASRFIYSILVVISKYLWY